MASALSIPGMEEAGKCPICMELFADPVTLDCGHNVCWGCLTDYCETWKDMEDLGCPVCRARIKDRKFQPNWRLTNVVENILLLQKYLCVKHKNELNLSCKIKEDELLCREDDGLLCVACERSTEQGQPMLLLEKVSQECEEDIQAELQFLQKKREKLMKQKVAEKQRSQRCLGTQAASPNKATNIPSTMASATPVTEVEEEAMCPICLEVLMDPVTLGCHHNFCRGCITDYCDKWEDLGDLECPVCRVRIGGRKFQRNYQLANIVENVQRAKKRLCVKHKKEINLFCKKDDKLLCVACERSPEHKLHTVLLLEEAAQEYKENIQVQLQSLEKERQELVEQKVAEEQRIQECLKQLRLEKLEIMSLFEQMRKLLEEKEHIWLTQLADLETEIKERQEENMTRLSEEISHFSDLIKDVEVKGQQPPSEFLQDIKCTLSRCQEGRERERLEPYPELEWRVRSFGLKSSALKRAKEQFEGSLNQVLPGKVSVTLDPDTAHPSLLVSEDLKSVRCENTNQNLPDHPERFETMPCVLGLENFTSGRHWWEVEVKMWSLIFIQVKEFLFGRECGMWCAGVAQESLRRKGDLIIRPDGGIWSVGEDPFQPYPFLYFTPPKLSPATLRPLPRKIRIFLDYEEGRVEFFDADTDRLIFAFPPATFSGEAIRPFFWVREGVCLQC